MDPEITNDKAAENSSSISSDLIRGHINTIILRTLYDGDKYGYEIINEIEEKSKGQYTLKQPTLYSALKRLEGQDYVTSYWGGVSNGGRRKYFQITDKGRKVVEQNLAEWEYSRTVIDSLISEKDFDFSNPPPSSLDFNLLKKSTTRVPIARGGEDEDVELPDGFGSAEELTAESGEEAAATSAPVNGGPIMEAPASEIEDAQEQFADIPVSAPASDEDDSSDMQASALDNASTIAQEPQPEPLPAQKQSDTTDQSAQEEPQPLTEEEKQRIHENYKVLIGDDTDATSYYYSQVARREREEQAMQQSQATAENGGDYADPNPYMQDYAPYPPSDGYIDERARQKEISSELLYSNKPPEERNYKELISRLYDRRIEQPVAHQDEVAEPEIPAEPAVQPAPLREEAPMPVQETPEPPHRSGNAEFSDVEEKAEREGLRITTTSGQRSRTVARAVGNTFDKGKALLFAALCVGAIALVECIINSCLHGALQTSVAYVVIPYVLVFAGVGVFLFLYLKGYGKNSRKSQSRSYISATLVIFANLVLIICVIAYFVIISVDQDISLGLKILKYAIFPVIFSFNLPLFAFFYRYKTNRE